MDSAHAFQNDDTPRPVLGVTRSVTGRRWASRLGPVEAAVAQAIVQKTAIPDIVARVIAARGVSADDAETFLKPSLRDLMPDPSSITDMDTAAERLADAVIAKEPVAIFGDYDVDGASSAALLARFLRSFGIAPEIHIPDRIFEGYGPNPEAVKALAAGGARLLVTVDCGTTSHETLRYAADIGLDTIVLDHHQTGTDLPPASAIVNPNRQDDLSGLGYLAAAGVVFLTLVATNRALRRRGVLKAETAPDLMSLVDLVALGTVADVVPLIGLNRAYVARGLDICRRRGNAGLAALADTARLSGPISAYHLGFIIGPRINAGGRIGNAGLGANLLTTDDPLLADAIAAELDRLNKERQLIEKATVEEADAMVLAKGGADGRPILVVAGDDWHPGVVGLVASRLKERYRKPVLALAIGRNGEAVGSARSIAGVDIGAAVRAGVDEELLIKGGGHVMAAGLTMEGRRIDEFEAFLSDRLSAAVEAAGKNDALHLDGAMTAGGATTQFIELLEKAGPFGAGNPKPAFAFPAHRVTYAEAVGADHIRCQIADGSGGKIKAIAFRAAGQPLGDFLLNARSGGPAHLTGGLTIDHWGGSARPQLTISDAARANKD